MENNELYDIKTFFKGNKYVLFDLAKWKNGLAFKNIDFSPTGKPIIKIAELNGGISSKTAYTDREYGSEVHISKGDILFSWSGNPDTSINAFKYQYEDGWLNQHIFKVTPYESLVHKDYLFYILKFLKPNFSKIAKNKMTTGLGHVTIADLKNIKISVPALSVQSKIASILSKIDDRIQINININKNLEEQAQTVFNSMFPDILGLSRTIGDYIIPKRGKNLLSKNAIPGDVPVVAGGLEPACYHNIANTKSPVITISASGANAGFVRLWHNDVWSSDSSYIDSTMTTNVYFWYILLKSRQKEITDAQTGSAQPHIYPKHIASMSINNVDIKKIKSYTERVTHLFMMIGQNLEINNKLSQIRDTILPKLISGEIDVEDIDI